VRKAQIYREIHRLLAADVPAEFLYFMQRYTACSSRLHGYDTGHIGLVGFGMEDWYIE
jgi:hypothetical protein